MIPKEHSEVRVEVESDLRWNVGVGQLRTNLPTSETPALFVIMVTKSAGNRSPDGSEDAKEG